MTIEEVDKIIQDLMSQIPTLQMKLHQAEGYRQALVDNMEVDNMEKDKNKDKTTKP